MCLRRVLLLSLLSLAHSSTILDNNHLLLLPSSRKLVRDDSVYCQSWRFSVEVNDAGKWSTVPRRCVKHVKHYMQGHGYSSDSNVAAVDSLEFAKSVQIAGDGKDEWVFDVDETLLSNLPYYQSHGYGSEEFNADSFNAWVKEAKAPVLSASLSLYKQLQQLGFKVFILTGRDEPFRKATEDNLKVAGFDNWEKLILSSNALNGITRVLMITEKRRLFTSQSGERHS